VEAKKLAEAPSGTNDQSTVRNRLFDLANECMWSNTDWVFFAKPKDMKCDKPISNFAKLPARKKIKLISGKVIESHNIIAELGLPIALIGVWVNPKIDPALQLWCYPEFVVFFDNRNTQLGLENYENKYGCIDYAKALKLFCKVTGTQPKENEGDQQMKMTIRELLVELHKLEKESSGLLVSQKPMTPCFGVWASDDPAPPRIDENDQIFLSGRGDSNDFLFITTGHREPDKIFCLLTEPCNNDDTTNYYSKLSCPVGKSLSVFITPNSNQLVVIIDHINKTRFQGTELDRPMSFPTATYCFAHEALEIVKARLAELESAQQG